MLLLEYLPPYTSTRNCYSTTKIQLHSLLKPLEAGDEHLPSSPSFPAETAKAICLASAREIATNIATHRRKWGIDRFPSPSIQWVSAGLFALLDGLDDPANRSAFIELCVVARSFSRRWPLAKAILRMIQLTAEQMGVLPSEVEPLFLDFERKDWTMKDRETLSSSYPNFAAYYQPGAERGSRADEEDMDAFLKKWDKLRLE